MKARNDPRHHRRQKIIKNLFAFSFNPNKKINHQNLIRPIIDHLPTIDKKITIAAPDFPLEGLNRIDLAILRLATFELLIKKSEPPKVIIDEAIELAKEFGSENSPGFINGALGTIMNNSILKAV
ncbi:MAG: transcription antitermination factor NusB [Candidatus Shapirobacteria bacterium]|nr:transcription antitermination factor NusB [Candidatus Shapirobacteria bacterium]